jgi:hypothetical protein
VKNVLELTPSGPPAAAEEKEEGTQE